MADRIRAAAVDGTTYAVLHVRIVDPAEYPLPRGQFYVEDTEKAASPGYSYDPGTGTFTPPPPEPITWERARKARNRALAETDRFMFPDAPVSKADLDELKAYRQQLRDIPQDHADTAEISWPARPALLGDD